jgi:hypothetical protein
VVVEQLVVVVALRSGGVWSVVVWSLALVVVLWCVLVVVCVVSFFTEALIIIFFCLI